MNIQFRIGSRLLPALLTIALTIGIVQTVDAQNGAKIRLSKDVIEMGNIPMNTITDSTGSIRITVYNDGNAPLILQKVNGCCGTTIKAYTRHPIKPNDSGYVQVYFRLQPRPQLISRTVTIHSNTQGKNPTLCHIEGRIVENEEKGRIRL